MENLTLPEPAASLWASKRNVLHSIPPERFLSTIRPHLGGGTILAARWQHRLSTDIDILLPGRNSLVDLLQENDRNLVKRLGGTPEAVGAGRVKIAFEHGRIDIVTFRPDPPYGHHETSVDGQLEQVLSSAQILRGKLQRVDQMLVRDVFDVLTAADEEPAALATAANMVTKQRATAIESAWRNAADALAHDFDDEIHGAARTDGTTLGRDTAAAFRDHRYTRLEIDITDDQLTIRKTTGREALDPETYQLADPHSDPKWISGQPARAIMESGVGTHLNNNGPVTAPQLLGAIRTAIAAGGRAQTILDTSSPASIAAIERLDRLPPAPDPEPSNSRGHAHDRNPDRQR